MSLSKARVSFMENMLIYILKFIFNLPPKSWESSQWKKKGLEMLWHEHKSGNKKKEVGKKKLTEFKNHILGHIFTSFSQTSQAKGKMWVFTWNFQSFVTVLNISII